ncbi:MAG TPA: paraquat-inducible protein A [Gammaproteobacteria bacterium]|nr:paraquat-inducible protein A [Gammaproteobacteria bacterium]
MYRPKQLLINLLLLLASVFFAIGVYLPVFTLTKLLIFNNTVSILSGLWQLVAEGEYVVFILIFSFSIILPITKISILTIAWNSQTDHHHKKLIWLEKIGRWSMLDVFVVALLIVTVKLGVLASVVIHAGLYYFTASVLIMMIVTKLVIQKYE